LRRIIRYILKKMGLPICEMCQDALATEPKDVCKGCADELLDIEMQYYHRNEMERMA
jgi:hypothetical protein